MRATIMFGPGDVRVENVPDATIKESTDALIRTVRACICGSDLWPYHASVHDEGGGGVGHEAVGVYEVDGREGRKVKNVFFFVIPFPFSEGVCDFCREGSQPPCAQGVFFNRKSPRLTHIHMS